MKLTKLFLLMHVLFFMSCSSDANNLALVANNSQFPKYDGDGYKLIHQFYGKDKAPLGSVYAKYITDEIFTSMVIKSEYDGKSNILYFIDETRFVAIDGIDLQISVDEFHRFYGYKVIIKKDDYIQLVYFGNEGKNVSDYVTIEWNYDEKKFQMMKTP